MTFQFLLFTFDKILLKREISLEVAAAAALSTGVENLEPRMTPRMDLQVTLILVKLDLLALPQSVLLRTRVLKSKIRVFAGGPHLEGAMPDCLH